MDRDQGQRLVVAGLAVGYGPDGITPSNGSVNSRIVLRNNIVHDTDHGIRIGRDTLLPADSLIVDVYDNVFYRHNGSAVLVDETIQGADPSLIRVLNNTAWSCSNCYYAGTGSNGRVLFQNNIGFVSSGQDFWLNGAISSLSSHNLTADATRHRGEPRRRPAAEHRPRTLRRVRELRVDYGRLGEPAPAVLRARPSAERVDLSSVFWWDVDGGGRTGSWDIGADEYGATTAVTLMSFEALPSNGAVDLAWRTGSEVDNLGFHLYRSLAADGPWTRLTPSLIPSQGFSAMGASYTWRDTGLQNGIRYFYRLEDVDTRSHSTFHGPVSAVPQADATPAPPEDGGSGDSGGSGGGFFVVLPAWALAQLGSSVAYTCETHGDPAATFFRVLSRTSRSALVELDTKGFLTARDATGRVRALIPGFDSLSDPLAPALPLKRARLDGVVGRQARIGSIQARDNRFFSGLVAAAVGYPQAVVAPDGTVNPGRREAELLLSRGAFPRVQARLAGEGFQGEDKTLALELMPLRYDASRGALVLSRRLTVRVDFAGAEPSEVGRGRFGRRLPRTRPDSSAYAFLGTSQKGLHSVAFEALFPGRSRPLDLASLRLTPRHPGRDRDCGPLVARLGRSSSG